jgi:hypothetical protein
MPLIVPVALWALDFAKYGIADIYHPSGGAHAWINRRRYLADFAPRLFK